MGSVPTGDSDGNDALKRRITALERALAYQRSAKSTTGKAGTTGLSRFYDGLGRLIVKVGDNLDGATSGLTVLRAGGSTLAEFIEGIFPRITLYDGNGRKLLGNDVANGGLDRPRLSMGQWRTTVPPGVVPTPPTSSTYVTLETCRVFVQAPAVRIDVMVSSSSLTATGNVRVINANGAVVMPATNVPVNSVTPVTMNPTLLPISSPMGSGDTFYLQTNLTAGTGSIQAWGLSCLGSATYDSA